MALTVKDSTGAAQTLHTDTTTEAGKHIAFHHVVSTPNAVADAASLGASDRYTLLAGNNGGAAKALATDASGHLQVDIAADSAGIATAANQLTINAQLTALNTGVALSANQGTMIASLASLDSAITTCDTAAVGITAALPAGDNNIGNVDVVTLPALPAGNNNIGNMDIETLPSLPSSLNHNAYTLSSTNTAEQLSYASVTATEAIQVKANAANAGEVFIGGSSVSNSNGWPLAAGEQVTIVLANVSSIYCYGASGDKIHWLST